MNDDFKVLFPTANDPIVKYLSVVLASGNFSEEAPFDVTCVDRVGSIIRQLVTERSV